MSFLIEIGLCIILAAIYFLASPLLHFVGKYVLEAITFNKYPPLDPTAKQKENITDIGAALCVVIIIIIFFVRNN